jgi:hypothetical protein
MCHQEIPKSFDISRHHAIQDEALAAWERRRALDDA